MSRQELGSGVSAILMERAACVTREGKRFDGATVVSILTNAV